MPVSFLSLLPQFAGPDPSLSALAGLGLLFAVMTVMWLAAYALVVDRAETCCNAMLFVVGWIA